MSSWDQLPCPHAGVAQDNFVRQCEHPQVLGTRRVSAEQCAGCYYRTLAMQPENQVPTVVLNVGCCPALAPSDDAAAVDDGQLSPALSVLEVIDRLRQGIRHATADWWTWPNVQAAYRELIRGTIAELPREPGSFAGRGIVIAGGGHYFAAAYVSLRVLRHVGCTLPVQLWHFRDELTERQRRLVEELGGECIGAAEHALATGFAWHDSWWKGWQLKSYALLHSPFREVLWLDADCYPTRDPEYLFDDLLYRERGSLFWPDLADSSCPFPPDSPLIFGAPALGDLPCEAGQLLIDKGLCWRELQLALFLNRHADFTYRLLWGDKDTFPIAWRRLGREYGRLWPIATATPQAILQHDAHGDVIFQHRARDKFRLAETNFPANKQPHPANVFNPALAHEEFCFAALQELRERLASPLPELPQFLATTTPTVGIGRGIVTSAGPQLQECAYVLFRLLRHVGCTLPIECWYLRAERDLQFEKLCAPLHVTFREAEAAGFELIDSQPRFLADASGIPGIYLPSAVNGYGVKPFAVAHSAFQEVLWLDADNCPTADPAYLFDSPAYQRTGAIFWPDVATRRITPKACAAFGVAYRDTPEIDSGQLLVDKGRSPREVSTAWFLAIHRAWSFQFGWGDKTLFQVAWWIAEREYALMPPLAWSDGMATSPSGANGVFVQHDETGRPLFHHRVCDNKYGRRNEPAGFPLHAVALAALHDLATARQPRATVRQIRIAAYDRPHYLREVVDRLKQCENLERFNIVASVDQRGDGTHHPEVLAILSEVTSDIRLRPRLDCNAHTHANLTDLAAEADWGFLLEDDIVLSRGALTWCLEHEAELLDNADSISLIGEQVSRADEHRDATFIKNYFNAWGTYFSPAGLQRALALWQPEWDGPAPRLSWDCHLTEAGWRSLLPVVPRSKNIGCLGKHCRSEADYASAKRDCWIDDTPPRTWCFFINGPDRKEYLIRHALPAHVAAFDRVVVLDKTSRFPAALGAEVVTVPADGEFTRAYQTMIDLTAPGDWLCWLDADEALGPEALSMIATRSFDPSPAAYEIYGYDCHFDPPTGHLSEGLNPNWVKRNFIRRTVDTRVAAVGSHCSLQADGDVRRVPLSCWYYHRKSRPENLFGVIVHALLWPVGHGIFELPELAAEFAAIRSDFGLHEGNACDALLNSNSAVWDRLYQLRHLDHEICRLIVEYCDVHRRERTRYPVGAGLLTADAEPWPAERPDLPLNDAGWFPPENAATLLKHIAKATVVVECGSYLGLSTRFLLERSPAEVIAIDTWLGSIEHYDLADCRELLPRLFEQFVTNCWPHRERLTMLRNTTANGLRLLHRRGVKPDLIYLDASHESEDVALDVQLIRKLFPEAILVGDDWTWESVRTGVAAAGVEPTQIDGSCWEVLPTTHR